MRSLQRAEPGQFDRAQHRVISPSDEGGDDARACRRIVTRNARTFAVASWLLPPPKRRAAYAVYATCRIADDIVDTQGTDGGVSLGALRQFREQVFRALNERSSQPTLRELARAWQAFQLPEPALLELFDALESDLTPRRYASWEDLEKYCQGVAGSVGVLCCSIFGLAADDVNHGRAIFHARTLGVAMQLTNILRDVGEDARRGRCYLPARELLDHGLRPEGILDGTVGSHRATWEAFLRFQVARARDLYRQAREGIPLLAPDTRSCALACADGYAKILDAIEAAPAEALTRRVSASRLTLLGVAWRSWRSPAMFDAVR